MITETVVLAAAMGVAAGLMGSFVVMRRMALAADALSHVALPGIGIALALHIHPLIGAVAMLMFGALLVWALEETTRTATETVIGVVFSAALAVGSMMTTGDDLIDALFGRRDAPGWTETLFAAAAVTVVVGLIIRQRHRLVLALVSPDLARTAGVNIRRLNLLYLQLFALTIALGLRYLGVLLMGSMLIIPAATAKRFSRNLTEMLALSAVMAVTAILAGSGIANWLHREPGPVIVSVAAMGFLISLWRRQQT
jgi:ABC-type Mn2+/Zn2+ transport system permease subunit